VAAALLERNDTRGWYDLLQGDDSIEDAITTLVKEKFDGIEGENLDRIYARNAWVWGDETCTRKEQIAV
jgi:hypothetical protein